MTIEQTSFPDPLSVVSLTTAKDHLRVDHSLDDTLITATIGAAYQMVEKYTGAFLQTTDVEFHFDHIHEFTNIHAGPNAIIDRIIDDGTQTKGVSYVDADGDRQFLAPADHQFDGVSYPSRLRVTSIPTDVSDQVNAWRVDVKTGYTNTDRPDPLVSAMLLIVGHLYENRQDVGGFKTHEIPMSSRYLMNPYRLKSFS